jgi:hypothetical protein
MISPHANSTGVRIVHTSGTTGGGLRFPLTLRAVQEQWAIWWRYLYPNVINSRVFRRRGVPRGHLLLFDGVKEDITFAGLDVEAIPPHDFGPRILVRPPAEDSHYYRSGSLTLTLELLDYLRTTGAQVVLSPSAPQPGQVRRFGGPARGLEKRHISVFLRLPRTGRRGRSSGSGARSEVSRGSSP